MFKTTKILPQKSKKLNFNREDNDEKVYLFFSCGRFMFFGGRL